MLDFTQCRSSLQPPPRFQLCHSPLPYGAAPAPAASRTRQPRAEAGGFCRSALRTPQGTRGGARDDRTGTGSAAAAAPRGGRPWIGAGAARGAEPPLSAVLDPPCVPGGLRLRCRPHPAPPPRTVVSPPPQEKPLPVLPCPVRDAEPRPHPQHCKHPRLRGTSTRPCSIRAVRHPENLRGRQGQALEVWWQGWGHPEAFPGRWTYGRSARGGGTLTPFPSTMWEGSLHPPGATVSQHPPGAQ